MRWQRYLFEVEELEKGFRLPGSDDLEKKWNVFRADSDVFEEKERKIQETPSGGKTDEWGFCISELLSPDSILFLGINPSAPENHVHTSFGPQEMKQWPTPFQRHLEIARNLNLNFSYWDIFPIRMTQQDETEKKFKKISESYQGRTIIRDMLELTRKALETIKPRAVYVCNSHIRDMELGHVQGFLGDLWREVNPLRLSTRECCEKRLPVPRGFKYYYNTMELHGSSIPVLLGVILQGKFARGKTQVPFIVNILGKALNNPESCF